MNSEINLNFFAIFKAFPNNKSIVLESRLEQSLFIQGRGSIRTPKHTTTAGSAEWEYSHSIKK